MICIATCTTRFGAMRCKKLCDSHGLPAQLMPVPRALSSSCGTCVRWECSGPYPQELHTDEVEQVVRVTEEGGYQVLYRAEGGRAASCAARGGGLGLSGCGAKVGADNLARMLEGLPAPADPRLIVGRDKSDDASVYLLDDRTALVQTADFSPPMVDDPFLFGQISAANALSDVYAMGGEPRLALNLLCVPEEMELQAVREILRGGGEKVCEAGAALSGGHSIHGAETLYGLSVTGFVRPDQVLTNSGARPGDILILTKPLGVGVLIAASGAGMAEQSVMARVWRQMAALNKSARDVMVGHHPHSCTDVTGFGLLGHSLEMARSSGCTLHILADRVPHYPEALTLAGMGFLPSGLHRNRTSAGASVAVRGVLASALEDLLYDPQTSGGLLIALPEEEAAPCLNELRAAGAEAAAIGYVTQQEDAWVTVHGGK